MNDYPCKKMNPETQLNWKKMFKAPVIAIALLSSASVTACTSVNQDKTEKFSPEAIPIEAKEVKIGMNQFDVYELLEPGYKPSGVTPNCENFPYPTPSGTRYTRVHYSIDRRVSGVDYDQAEECFIE